MATEAALALAEAEMAAASAEDLGLEKAVMATEAEEVEVATVVVDVVAATVVAMGVGQSNQDQSTDGSPDLRAILHSRPQSPHQASKPRIPPPRRR